MRRLARWAPRFQQDSSGRPITHELFAASCSCGWTVTKTTKEDLHAAVTTHELLHEAQEKGC